MNNMLDASKTGILSDKARSRGMLVGVSIVIALLAGVGLGWAGNGWVTNNHYTPGFDTGFLFVCNASGNSIPTGYCTCSLKQVKQLYTFPVVKSLVAKDQTDALNNAGLRCASNL